MLSIYPYFAYLQRIIWTLLIKALTLCKNHIEYGKIEISF